MKHPDDMTNNELIHEIFRLCLHRSMSPRVFYIRFLGFAGKSEAELSAIESERGHKQRVIQLLSRILRIKPETVQKWGTQFLFDRIPKEKKGAYQRHLGNVDSIRVLVSNLHFLDRRVLINILHQLE